MCASAMGTSTSTASVSLSGQAQSKQQSPSRSKTAARTSARCVCASIGARLQAPADADRPSVFRTIPGVIAAATPSGRDRRLLLRELDDVQDALRLRLGVEARVALEAEEREILRLLEVIEAREF